LFNYYIFIISLHIILFIYKAYEICEFIINMDIFLKAYSETFHLSHEVADTRAPSRVSASPMIQDFQQMTTASIGLLVLAQAYTVCCGDRMPANLQQQQRALQRGCIAVDSAMRITTVDVNIIGLDLYSAHCCVTQARVADVEPPPPLLLRPQPCQQTHGLQP